jgi:hypothetical protein
MSDEQRPKIKRIGIAVHQAWLPPWSGQIEAPIEKVREVLDYTISTSHKAAIYTPPDTTEIEYQIIALYGGSQAFIKLIVKPSGNNTNIWVNGFSPVKEDNPFRVTEADKLKSATEAYFFIISSLRDRFIGRKIPIITDAPLVDIDDEDFEIMGIPPAPKSQRPSAKYVLVEYQKRKRRNKKLTLKQFCTDIGANYDSIKAAKYRYTKPKKQPK